MSISRFVAVLGFILLGIMSRLLPHPPNATAINALALFSAFYLGNRWIAITTLFATMFISDLFFSVHSTASFVYIALGMIVLIGDACNKRLKSDTLLYVTPFISLATSLLFFIVTNFGVWMTTSMYPKTLAGLGLCYLAAIPFLTTQIFWDLVYGSSLFGILFLLRRRNLFSGVLIDS